MGLDNSTFILDEASDVDLSQHASERALRRVRRTQAVLACLAVALALPVAVVFAPTTAGPVDKTVDAVLVSPSASPELATIGLDTPVPARWQAPDGTPRAGTIEPPAGLPAGAVIRVEVDAAGTVLDASPPPPRSTGIALGVVMVLGTWALIALAGRVARGHIARTADNRLTDEWAVVEPLWSGRNRA